MDDGRVGRCGSTGSRAPHERQQRDRGRGGDRAHSSRDPHPEAAARAGTQPADERRAKRLRFARGTRSIQVLGGGGELAANPFEVSREAIAGGHR
jgi:hypothetical protein